MPTASPPSRDVALETRFFLERFKKEIIAVLIIALLAVLAFTGYRYYSDRRAAAAAASLANAKTAQEYQQVIDRYPNSPAAADGYLLLAEAQRSEKKFAQANTTLQTFVDKFTPPGVTQTIPTRERVWNFLGGIQLKNNTRDARVKPFGHALAGVAHYTDRQQQILDLFPQFNFTIEDRVTSFAMKVGGGLDIRAGKA